MSTRAASVFCHSATSVFFVLIGFFCSSVLSGCGSSSWSDDISQPVVLKPRPKAPDVPSPVQFADVTAHSGIKFKHNNGAFGLRLMPETLGSGVAFIDYDKDGWQDVFFVNSRDWTEDEIESYKRDAYPEHARVYGFKMPTPKPRQRSIGALYHNNRDGTFSDVTQGSGLEVEMLGMGACVGDYDDDGKADLYLTSYGRNFLFRNESGDHNPRFRDVTSRAGVRDSGWSTAAAFLDYDRDGDLDLFVGHYVKWTPATEIYFSADAKTKSKSYNGPDWYPGTPNVLFRNEGEGRFTDVSANAGVQTATAFTGRLQQSERRIAMQTQRFGAAVSSRINELRSKALGVVVTDYNGDGWPDIVVANDTLPTMVFENRKNGTFTDVAAKVGLALVSPTGASGGMGIDAADIDHSGRESVVIGYYADQLMGLYRNVGSGLFEDVSAYAELGRPGTKFVTFGCVFMDIDNNGWPDILATNGHVMDDIHISRRDLTYAQRCLLFLNRRHRAGEGIKFDEIGLQAGATRKPVVGRGLACADIDQDGDVDVIITTNGGSPLVLRNEGDKKNNAIRLTLQSGSNHRDAIGAVVVAQAAEEKIVRVVRSGSSYLSQSELPLTLGVGKARRVETLLIRWPSGTQTLLKNVPSGHSLIVRERVGVVQQVPLRQSPLRSHPKTSATQVKGK